MRRLGGPSAGTSQAQHSRQHGVADAPLWGIKRLPRRPDADLAAERARAEEEPRCRCSETATGCAHQPPLQDAGQPDQARRLRSEEHTSELQSLMRISYAVFCLKNKK